MSEGLWWWPGDSDEPAMRPASEPDESEWLPTDDPGVWYIPDPPEPEATPAEERMSPAPPVEPKEPLTPRPPRKVEPDPVPHVPRIPTATEQWEMPEDAAHWGQPTAPEEDVMGRPNAPGLTPVEMASFTVRRTGRDAFDNVAATLRELVAQEAARWIQAARQEATWH
ncbi:MAG: hypothetical protein Fur0036_04050 [Fimbriimonadaceae bacterium]